MEWPLVHYRGQWFISWKSRKRYHYAQKVAFKLPTKFKVPKLCFLLLFCFNRQILRFKVNKTRCKGHSKYVRSLFDSSYFYKKKAVIIFLRWGVSAHPYPPGWGCSPDPAFLEWHWVPNGIKTKYTKLKINQAKK